MLLGNTVVPAVKIREWMSNNIPLFYLDRIPPSFPNPDA